MHFALVALLAASAPVAKPTKQLPQGMKLDGKVVAGLSYADALGDNVVLVSRTNVHEVEKGDEHYAEQYLYGAHFVRSKDGAWRELWRTQDFVKECMFDLTLDYKDGSLAVTDLDGDGTAETRFAYELNCASDVTPNGLKLLMHEGEAKYAVRGTVRAVAEVDDKGKQVFIGGELTLDPTLAAVAPFAKDATERFKKLQN